MDPQGSPLLYYPPQAQAYPLAPVAAPPSPFRSALGGTLGTGAGLALAVGIPTLIVVGAIAWAGWQGWKGFRSWRASRAEARAARRQGRAVLVRDVSEEQEAPALDTGHGCGLCEEHRRQKTAAAREWEDPALLAGEVVRGTRRGGR